MTDALGLLGVGLFLGMRHAMDPDHVIAMTAISTRTASFLAAARLGLVWGFGHTVTLFTAGSAIILFDLVVPRAAALSMEFVVGIALVVVGVLSIDSSLMRGSAGQDGLFLSKPQP